jgi:F0F1-type ATP synthase membrane subunit c/vacuolar-type H+-ATPase subunit K
LDNLSASSAKNIATAAWTIGGIAAALSAFLAVSLRKFLQQMVFDIRSGEKNFGHLMFSRVIIFLAIGESAAIFGFAGFMLTGDAVILLGLSAASLFANLLWIPAPAWALQDRKEEKPA